MPDSARNSLRVAGIVVLLSVCVRAQVTKQDYERAAGLQERLKDLTVDVAEQPSWVQGKHEMIYSKTVAGGHQFFVADADTGAKRVAFDHARLAGALHEMMHDEVKPLELPFRRARLLENDTVVGFEHNYQTMRCDLKSYTCKGPEDVPDEDFTEDPNASTYSLNSEDKVRSSPDKHWDALVENYNVVVRSRDRKQHVVLSTDGSEGNYYALDSLTWSPDSQRLVAYRVRPGFRRMVHYVESSPATQLQPIYSEVEYTKPGDTLPLQQPVLFDVGTKHELTVAKNLFPNPFSLSRPAWRKDSRAFTFEYNQRGHQLYRVIEVDAKTGASRSLVDEESKTFVDYRPLVMNQEDTGKKFRHDLDDGKEMLWASERDGWEHLYRIEGVSGRVQQITKGDWVVRAVNRVDDQKQQIWFEASGVNPGEDPYFVHGYRITFDGTDLTPLTPGAGDHHLEYSDDGVFYVDLVSTVDTAPVMTLYRTEGNTRISELERGNLDRLRAAGWHSPEVFTAKGRDGKTDIWGLVWKPANFDPKKKYPVIENIYAGPQGSFVPKTFTVRGEPLTELGFAVVQIDGMGTNNRPRAFHDVAFKNLKDAGLPDRIAWHRAYAAKNPWYDLARVGIFGTSAGGQSAMGALLFHPEFYKAAVSNSGCHDNRMDKIWWNEQWMSWPIGPEYTESSNVDNAWRLQGKLLLVVGEMDKNVDPSSTFQVADRLEKANKDFDLLYVPGGGHGAGGKYGQRKLEDFFVRNLRGQTAPAWNEEKAEPPTPQ